MQGCRAGRVELWIGAQVGRQELPRERGLVTGPLTEIWGSNSRRAALLALSALGSPLYPEPA